MSIATGLPRAKTSAGPQMAPSRTPLARLRGWPYWAIPSALLIGLSVYLYLLATSPMDPITHRQLVSEGGQIASLLVALSLCIAASFNAPPGRTRWAWRCFALGFTTYAAAEAVFGYESIVTFAGQATPTPTIADALYLPFYPLMIAGLLLLPSASLSGSSRARVVLDAGITTSALFGFALIYLISPYFQGGTPPFELAVLVAYPTGDSVLVLALILLLARGVQKNYRPVVFWLVLGLVSFVFADVGFDRASFANDYVVGAINIDPFWAVGELLMSLAPLHLLIYGDATPRIWDWIERLAPEGEGSALGVSLRRVLLPYLSVLVLLALLFFSLPHNTGDSSYLALEALIVMVVLLVIGRQVLLGRDLVDAQISYRRAEQLDDLKNQFISSVNHELRTPLMTMQTYIELLRERHAQLAAPERGTVIEEVGRTSDALVDLVQSILEVRRLDQETSDFAREAVSVRAVLAKSVALVNPYETQKAQRSLHVEMPQELTIWGESVRLQQILTNLLTNAVKYSPPGTEIEVIGSVLPADKKGRRRGDSKPMVELIVRDHGFGIPPDEAPLLFNRFVRLPRDLASNVVGSGLGLYLCRTLTEAMGGQIWVESTGIPGEGSTFHVVLPSANPAEIAASGERDRHVRAREQVMPAATSTMPDAAMPGSSYLAANRSHSAVANQPYTSATSKPVADATRRPYTGAASQPFNSGPSQPYQGVGQPDHIDPRGVNFSGPVASNRGALSPQAQPSSYPDLGALPPRGDERYPAVPDEDLPDWLREQLQSHD